VVFDINGISLIAMFEIKPCKTKAAYSVKPVKNINLDLEKIKKRYKTIVDTPITIVIGDFGGLVIHKHGQITFKTLKDEKKIKRIANKIYKLGL